MPDKRRKLMEKFLFLGDLFYDYEYLAKDIEVLSEWIKKNNYITKY